MSNKNHPLDEGYISRIYHLFFGPLVRFKHESTSLTLTKKEKASINAAYKKELLDAYKERIRRNMWNQVEEMAQEDSRKIAETLYKERSRAVANALIDSMLTTKPKKESK